MREKEAVRLGAPSVWQERWLVIKRSPRVVALAAFVLFVLGVFVYRLWYLQFAQAEYYNRLAEIQRLEVVSLPAPRGVIYARDGTALVRNVPSFRVTITPAYLPDDEAGMGAVLFRLSQLLGVPYSSGETDAGGEQTMGLREMVDEALAQGAYYAPLVVRRGVERDTALLVAQERLTLPGVSVELDSVREYLYGPLVSQIVGYVLPIPGEYAEEYAAAGYDITADRIGFAGVEYTYEDVLRGHRGEQLVEEDVMGRVIRVVEQRAMPVPGGNVFLTIDLDLQQFTEQALREGMARAGNSPRGVAIVMNPQTGEILALVSLPTYDNNLFTRGISMQELQRLNENPHRPQLNHAIADRLQPGSVFKVIIAAGALQEGILNGRRTRLNCPGVIVVPNRYYPNDPGRAQPFYCWNRGGHGWLDVVGGIANSCNVFFYKVGGGFEPDHFEGLGMDEEHGIPYYARLFGFGAQTGVELTGEISGTVPTATWKRRTYGENWSTGDTYNLSIGEGYIEVTPLQMLNAINVIANGGVLYRPRVVHHTTDAEGNVIEPFRPEIIRTLPISPENWSLIQQGMEEAVVYGTATRAQVEGVRVAGKTGTAQYCDDLARASGLCRPGYAQPTHAWFAAFAPVGQPEISVIVFIYNGGEGSVYAAPVAQDIMEYYFTRNGAPSE